MSRDFKEKERELKEVQRQAVNIRKEVQHLCYHRFEPNNPKELKRLSDTYNKNLATQFSETTVMCDGECGCHKIFEAAEYSEKDVNACQFQIESMLEQIKYNAGDIENFPGHEEGFEDMIAAVSVLPRLCEAYLKIMKARNGNANQRRRKDNSPKKGVYGMPNPYGRSM